MMVMDKDEAEKKIRQSAKEGKVVFASQENMEFFEEFSQHFLHVILDCEGAWLSDESSLSDFHPRDAGSYERIEAEYGVDVRGHNNLLEIFRMIANKPSNSIN